MSRERINYASAPISRSAVQALDTDTPVAGFYRMRMRSGGSFVGIRIWFGRPLDPVTGEEIDRSLRWQATANGHPVDLDRVWPKCGGDPIDESEHHYLSAVQAWAKQHAPASPQANPNLKINPLTAPTPF